MAGLGDFLKKQKITDAEQGIHRDIPFIVESAPLPTPMPSPPPKPAVTFTLNMPKTTIPPSPEQSPGVKTAAGLRVDNSDADTSLIMPTQLPKPAAVSFKLAAPGLAKPQAEAKPEPAATVSVNVFEKVQNVQMSDLNNLVVSDATYDRGAEPYSQKELEIIRSALETLRGSFEFPDTVGANLRIVMQSLAANPNLRDILLPEDIGVMVRGLRTSYGVHIAKADVRSDKRSKTAKDKEDAADFLKSIGAVID